MKKLFVHLSLLCLLAALLVPMVGCGRGDETNTAVEESTATTEVVPPDTGMETGTTDMGTMGTDMGTGTMGTDMGTGMGTTTPPAQ